MQITLFKALKAIKVDDDTASAVVVQLEDFIVRKVEDANKGIEAQLRAQTWLIGTIGAVIAVFGFVLPIVLKLTK